jgi:hypothetical protein
MSVNQDSAILMLAAGYSTVSQAEKDYKAVISLYDEAEAAGYFDAAVISPRKPVSSRIVRKLQPPARRRGPERVDGVAAQVALFIFEGLARAGGAVGTGTEYRLPGAPQDGNVSGLAVEDLARLAKLEAAASAVVVVVFPTNMAERVAATITATETCVSKEIHASAEEVAARVRAAEEKLVSGR